MNGLFTLRDKRKFFIALLITSALIIYLYVNPSITPEKFEVLMRTLKDVLLFYGISNVGEHAAKRLKPLNEKKEDN